MTDRRLRITPAAARPAKGGLEESAGPVAAKPAEVRWSHPSERPRHLLIDQGVAKPAAVVDHGAVTPKTIGPYEVKRLIGRGGMGEVYLAYDPRLGRDVALKVLPAELAHDRDRRDRFLCEARAVTALNHPGIATIHEIAKADGRDFLAMEYLEGGGLDAVPADRKPSYCRPTSPPARRLESGGGRSEVAVRARP